MKKALIILFVVVAIIGGAAFFGFKKLNSVRSDLNIVSTKMVTHLSQNGWSPEAFHNVGSDAFKAWAKTNSVTLQQFSNYFAGLGAATYKQLEDFNIYKDMNTGRTDAETLILVTFAKEGDLLLSLSLSKKAEQDWKLNSINIQ